MFGIKAFGKMIGLKSMKTIRNVASALLLFTLFISRSASAEWWLGGWNGEFNYFLDVDSVMAVESVGKVKAWVAYVKEGSQEKATPNGLQAKAKSNVAGKTNNEVYRVLLYVSCDEWTSKDVRVLLIDRKTRDVLVSSKNDNVYTGYTDIDTESLGNDFAKIICASDPREVAKGMGWGPIDSKDDYISASETFFKVTSHLNASKDAEAAGRKPPPLPPEVVGWMERKMRAESSEGQGEAESVDEESME